MLKLKDLFKSAKVPLPLHLLKNLFKSDSPPCKDDRFVQKCKSASPPCQDERTCSKVPFHLVKIKEFVQKCKISSPPCKDERICPKVQKWTKSFFIIWEEHQIASHLWFAHLQRIKVKKLSQLFGRTTKDHPLNYLEKNTPKTSPLQPTCDVSAHLKPRLPRTSFNQSSTWLFKVLKEETKLTEWNYLSILF